MTPDTLGDQSNRASAPLAHIAETQAIGKWLFSSRNARSPETATSPNRPAYWDLRSRAASSTVPIARKLPSKTNSPQGSRQRMAARVIDPARTAVTMRVSTPAGYTDPLSLLPD